MCQLLTIGHQGYYMLVVLAFLEKKKRIYELLLEIKKYVTGENLSWRRADNLIWWIGPI